MIKLTRPKYLAAQRFNGQGIYHVYSENNNSKSDFLYVGNSKDRPICHRDNHIYTAQRAGFKSLTLKVKRRQFE